MTRGAPQFDKSETTPTGTLANDVAGIARDDEGEKPQTSPTASVASLGKGKDPPDPQGSEFEDSNLHVEMIINNGDETGSYKEVPGEKNEQETNETCERGTNHNSAKGDKGVAESDWENQNLQAKFLIGKRDKMTSTAGKLQLDDKIDNGKRGANDKLDNGHTKYAERVVGKTQNTPEEVDNEPKREIISETKSDKGKVSENTRETGEGKDADHHSDAINMSDNECVSRNEKPENVKAHKLLMGEREESRSSETVKAKGQDDVKDETGKGGDLHPTTDDTHGKGETVTLVQVREQEHARNTESAIAGNQVDDDKIETEKEGAKDQSVKSEIGNAESGKRHQTLKGDLGTESSESADNKRQEGDASEPEKGEACEWPSYKKKAETIDEQLARGSETIKNDKVMKEGKAKKETTKRNYVLSTDGQVTAERVYQERSDIGSVEQGRITKGETRLVEPRARAEAVGTKVARKHTSTDQSNQKRTKKPSQQPVLPATVPGTRPSAVDLVSGAATSIHLEAEALRQSQEYRLQMSARNLLMHSKLPSYLNEIGMQQLPPAYYFHHYPPLDPAAYLPPDILHPLQYRHLHHPRPYAAVPYATGLPIPLHARPFEAVTRLALAEGRPLGSQMHSAPMFGPSPIQGVAEAELLRVVPTVQGADLSGRALVLGPSMHSHLHAFDPVRPVQAQQAEAIAARAAFLNNVAALGIPPPSVAYRQEIPPTMAEAVAAVASRAAKKQVQELPEVDPATMDKATLDRVRRERRNSQARNREARRRLQLEQIEAKPSNQRTEEEQRLWEEYDKRRQKKNAGARNRSVEKKKEVERILSLPAEARAEEDTQFLELYIGQKKRKVDGDRLRRVRMQQLGFAVNEKVPGITARGPLPPEYQRALEAKRAKEFSKDDYPG